MIGYVNKSYVETLHSHIWGVIYVAMVDYSIKLTPTRDERRELDRAARAAGFKNTGPWALPALLAVARGSISPKVVPASTVAVRGAPPEGVAHVTRGAGFTSARHLIPSYDPDGEGKP